MWIVYVTWKNPAYYRRYDEKKYVAQVNQERVCQTQSEAEWIKRNYDSLPEVECVRVEEDY